jgi:hypothetical protein
MLPESAARKVWFALSAKKLSLAIGNGIIEITLLKWRRRDKGAWVSFLPVCIRIALLLLDQISDRISPLATGNLPQGDLRRGRSLLGREQDVHESGLALFKRGATLRRKREQTLSTATTATAVEPEPKKNQRRCYTGVGPGGPWMIYCSLITACFPPFLLNSCGMPVTVQSNSAYSSCLPFRSP